MNVYKLLSKELFSYKNETFAIASLLIVKYDNGVNALPLVNYFFRQNY